MGIMEKKMENYYLGFRKISLMARKVNAMSGTIVVVMVRSRSSNSIAAAGV